MQTESTPARPKLILHIGFSKCGSTTLQRFMLQSQEILRRHGIVQINQDLAHPGAGKARLPAQQRLGRLLPQPGAASEIAQALSAIAEAMKTHGDRQAVISGESLSNFANYAAFFAPAKALFDVKVVAYIRPQEDFLPSYWKQTGLHQGSDLDSFIDDAMERMAPKYLPKLTAWAEVFGLEAMEIGSLLRPALQGGELITLEELDGTGSDRPVNPSFDFHILKTLQNVHEAVDRRRLNQLFTYLESALPEAAFRTGKVPLSPDRRAQIRAYYADANQKLLTLFMPGASYATVFGADPDPESTCDVSDDPGVAAARTLGYTLLMLEEQAQTIQNLRSRVARLEGAADPAHAGKGAEPARTDSGDPSA